MTPEQKAALARIRAVLVRDNPREWIDLEDIKTIMSEHPADEDVLIDEKWIVEHGVGDIDLDDAWSAFLKRIEPSEPGPLNITRGDASRLLRVLGIELKE